MLKKVSAIVNTLASVKSPSELKDMAKPAGKKLINKSKDLVKGLLDDDEKEDKD